MPSERAMRIADDPSSGLGAGPRSAFLKQLELCESLDPQNGQTGSQHGAFAGADRPDHLEPAIWKVALRQDVLAAQTGETLSRRRFSFHLPEPQVSIFDNEAPARLSAPVQFVMRLVELWNLDDGAVARLLGFEPQDSTAAANLLGGRTRLTKDAKDRVANLVRIRSLLDNLYRDIGAENRWLNTPKHELNHRTPRAFLDDGTLESLLTLRYFVEHLSRL